MRDLVGICGGALLAAVILVIIRRIVGHRIMHACSERMAFFGIIAVVALLALVAALSQ